MSKSKITEGVMGHRADGTPVEFVAAECTVEGCTKEMVLWTSGSTDHKGNARPRPTEASVLCAGHGFDKHLGRDPR